MAGVLDPNSGFRHCIVAYTTDHDEISDIAFYLLNGDFEIVEKHGLRGYIQPDFSRLTASSNHSETTTASTQNARSLVKLKKKPGIKPTLSKKKMRSNQIKELARWKGENSEANA